MTVHMVRLYIEPPKGEADSAINNWVTNHNEWEDDADKQSLVELSTDSDLNTTYVRADYRFIQDSTVTTLLDDLERNLSNIQGGLWYRIGYHKCDHDDNPSANCDWDPNKTRENGTVPSDIPNFD